MTSHYYLTIVILLSLQPHRARAVHLSELFTSTDFRFYPYGIHSFTDDTVLVSAGSTYPIAELNLHPIVALDEKPSPTSETFLVSRVHRKNSTVIWAAAISSLENSFYTAIDEEDNAYVVGLLNTNAGNASPISIIKFAPDGTRVYTQNTRKFPDNSYMAEAWGTTVAYAAPAALLVAAESYSKGTYKYHVWHFNTATGKFLRAVTLPKLKTNYEAVDLQAFAASSDMNVACFALRGQYSNGDEDLDAVVVQCTSLKDNGVTVSRELPRPVGGATVFNVRAIIEEASPGAEPTLRIVFERAMGFSYSAPAGKSEAMHEMVVHRLDTSTLKDVDWKTGVSRKNVDPLVISLPKPIYPNSAVSVIKILYSKSANAVAVLLDTTVRFKGASQDSRGGDVTIAGGKESVYIWPPMYWIASISQDRDFSLRRLRRDPRGKPVQDSYNRLLIEDLAFAQEDNIALAYGFLETIKNGNEIESGPLFFHEIHLRFKQRTVG